MLQMLGGGGGGGILGGGSEMGSGAEASATGGSLATGSGAAGTTPPAGIDWMGHLNAGMDAWNRSQQGYKPQWPNTPGFATPGTWFNQQPSPRAPFSLGSLIVPIMSLISMMKSGGGTGTPFELSGWGPGSDRKFDTSQP